MALAKKFKISVHIQAIDEEGNATVVGSRPFSQEWDVDAHNAQDAQLTVSNGATPSISPQIGGLTTGISTPSAVVVYEPDNPVNVALDAASTYSAPAAVKCNLFIAVRFDGGDMAVDSLNVSNPSTTIVANPFYIVSGDFA